MQREISTPETILEMLGELEAGIAALRAAKTRLPAGMRTATAEPAQVRRQMDRLGLSTDDVARIFAVEPEVICEWLWGRGDIPSWVCTSLLILGMLTPSAQARVLGNGKPSDHPVHPFSRIEEL